MLDVKLHKPTRFSAFLLMFLLVSLTLGLIRFSPFYVSYGRLGSGLRVVPLGPPVVGINVDPANETNLALTPVATSPVTIKPDGDGNETDWIPYGCPPPFESNASSHTSSGYSPTSGVFTDAYDQNMTTYVEFNWEYPGGNLDLVTFDTSTGSIGSVSFKMKYSATAATGGGEYVIRFSIDGSTWVDLAGPTGLAHSVPPEGYDEWPSQARPGGGSWTWTDINDIQFRVITTTVGFFGAGTFRLYEAWLTVSRGDYQVWDEYPSHDGDATYVKATTYDLHESSTLEDHAAEAWDIAKVTVTAYAKANLTSDDELFPILVIGGSVYYGKSYTLTNTYTAYTSEWAMNPDTDTFWTWSDINSMEAGVHSWWGDDWEWEPGNEMRVTQLYVEVFGPRFSVDILVENVDDLWLYQFELTFNPDVLQGVWYDQDGYRLRPGPVQVGPFLGEDGGTVKENEGAGWNNTLGKLRLTGAYLQQHDPAYCPDGDGVLSTVVFEVIAKGESKVRLGEETALQDPTGTWICYGRGYVDDGYFRNVAWNLLPKADFSITPLGTPEPMEGYNTTFTSTTTGGTTPYTYKWYFWRFVHRELFWPVVTSTDTVSRNYTWRGTWNVTLTVIDDDDVVGTKWGYVTIKAHDIFFTGIYTNTTVGQWPSALRADIGQTLEVKAEAINEGDYTETFNVTTFWAAHYAGAYHYGHIGTQTSITLAPGLSQNVTFLWDTAGCNVTHAGVFAVHANASAHQYEWDTERDPTKIADNEFTGPGIRIRLHDTAVTGIDVYNYLLIKPVGDGTYTDWTGTYLDWDDQPGHDGDATYVKAAADNLNESSTLTDHTVQTWSIEKVRVTAVARYNTTTNEYLQLMLVIGGTTSVSSTRFTLTNVTYSECVVEWNNNPATGSAWTWCAIDALEAGVKSTARYGWSGEIRVTQLYVEVFGPVSTEVAVTKGEVVRIAATVTNEGDYNETSISATAYYDSTSIGTDSVPLLTNRTFGRYPRFATDNFTKTFTFTWDTTTIAYGNYTISSDGTIVPYDYDSSDNTMTDGWVIITVSGDLDSDFDVDDADLLILKEAYGSCMQDVLDFFNLCKNYGWSA